MRVQPTIWTILLFASIPITAHSQTSPLYDLERRLMLGEKQALFEIAPYFDSKRSIVEFLGHHIINTTEASVSKRIVSENCIFIPEEIVISDSTTTKQFSELLSLNYDKIEFSELAQAFLITPLVKRDARYETRELTAYRRNELKAKVAELQKRDWAKSAGIDVFIYMKDPRALMIIASELYKRRYRFNRRTPDLSELTDLLQGLMGTEYAVENEREKMSWHPDKEFYPNAFLNLLIYFSNHYQEYHWDNHQSIFINPSVQPKTTGNEESLFQQLSNESDSIAMDAFIQLTTCPPQKVIQLSDEYEQARMDKNYSLPIFPYRFLNQLVVLTDYCKMHAVDFKGADRVRNTVLKLDLNLSFRERRTIEDSLVNTLTLSEITAFEYWSLIYQNSYSITYSAGRILDKFYSRHWTELLENDDQLALYLKKSILLDQLGIIGICNNYLIKFMNANSRVIDKLNSLSTDDPDITNQIERAKAMCSVELKRPNIVNREFEGNMDFPEINVKKEIKKITRKVQDTSEKEYTLVVLLAKINYNQIGVALNAIENISFQDNWKKYSFMHRDFGFFMADFDTIIGRQEFLTRYNSLSEYELYSAYLDEAGIDYKNLDNSLNYDKIFELLKYDAVVAFAGGGGSIQDNEVYSLIKLLELTHGTTLGYPHKLCNSRAMYACSSDDRAKEWMQYIVDNNLLKAEHDEPVSYHLE